MNTFRVVTPDGATRERISARGLTYALVVNYGARWDVHGWYESQKLAERQRAQYLYNKTFQPEAMQIVAVEAVPA